MSEPRPLSPAEAAALLHAQAETLRAEVTALPPDLAAWHPATGQWCVNEALGHLIEAERRGFAGRIAVLLAEESPRLQTWDQAAVAQSRQDCDRDAKELLDEFLVARAQSVALVAGLKVSQLERQGEHPYVGLISVGDIMHEWLHHDRNHVKQIFSIVQDHAFPSMGNCQRFVGE